MLCYLSEQAGDDAVFVHVDGLCRRGLGQTRHGENVPRQGHDEPGSGGDLHLPHRQDEVLRGPQLRGVIGKTVLGLGHAHRQAAEAQLRQAVDLPVSLLGIGHIAAAVDTLGQGQQLVPDGESGIVGEAEVVFPLQRPQNAAGQLHAAPAALLPHLR